MRNIWILLLIAIISLGIGTSCQSESNSEVEADTLAADSIIYQEERIAIPVDSIGGVYSIPAKVNGLKMNFIFDTGASEVSLSLAEAIFMVKNGYLKDEDIRGSAKTQLANGDIEENTRIVLKEIEVEGVKIHNVPALVVNNIDAPLLLGQSAIKELGEVLIKEDSIFIIRKAKSSESKTKTKTAQLKKREKSWFEKMQDKIGFHNYQDDIDSLLLLAKKAYDDDDCIQANYYLNKCVSLCENHKLWVRNWEIYYLKGRIVREKAKSIDESWEQSMPYYKLAFDSWDKRSEGFAISVISMLGRYARGISQHYSIPIIKIQKNRILEKDYEDSESTFVENIDDEFSCVINYLLKYDPYNAYCYCGWYYMDNITLADNYLQKALAIKKKEPMVYQNLGCLYMKTNKNKAIDYLNQSLVFCNDKNSLGYSYRLLAMCYENNYNRMLEYSKLAAQNGDIEAINWMEKEGWSW